MKQLWNICKGIHEKWTVLWQHYLWTKRCRSEIWAFVSGLYVQVFVLTMPHEFNEGNSCGTADVFAFKFSPHFAKKVGCNWSCLSYNRRYKFWQSGSQRNYVHSILSIPHKKKFGGIRSGERDGQVVCPLLPIHLPGNWWPRKPFSVSSCLDKRQLQLILQRRKARTHCFSTQPKTRSTRVMHYCMRILLVQFRPLCRLTLPNKWSLKTTSDGKVRHR